MGTSIHPVVRTDIRQTHLFGIVLDVVALQLDELIEAEFAQSLSLSGVFPANPR